MDSILLGDALALLDQTDNGIELLVGFPECLLELLVGIDQALKDKREPNYILSDTCYLAGSVKTYYKR